MKIVIPDSGEFKLDALRDFVSLCQEDMRTKGMGLANGSRSQEVGSQDGSQGKFSYNRQFFGTEGFIELHIIRFGNIPVYGISYGGRFRVPNGLDNEQRLDFGRAINQVMRQVDSERPFEASRERHINLANWGNFFYSVTRSFSPEFKDRTRALLEFSCRQVIDYFDLSPDPKVFRCLKVKSQGRILVPDSYVVK